MAIEANSSRPSCRTPHQLRTPSQSTNHYTALSCTARSPNHPALHHTAQSRATHQGWGAFHGNPPSPPVNTAIVAIFDTLRDIFCCRLLNSFFHCQRLLFDSCTFVALGLCSVFCCCWDTIICVARPRMFCCFPARTPRAHGSFVLTCNSTSPGGALFAKYIMVYVYLLWDYMQHRVTGD